MQDKYLGAVVLERRPLTDRIVELKIGCADGRPLPMAEAGSHLEVRFGGAQGYFHRHLPVVEPLTLDAEPEPLWRIAVQRENGSRGSEHIHTNFRSGTRLKVFRPIGAFRLGRNLPHVLLIPGGIGTTPHPADGPVTTHPETVLHHVVRRAEPGGRGLRRRGQGPRPRSALADISPRPANR